MGRVVQCGDPVQVLREVLPHELLAEGAAAESRACCGDTLVADGMLQPALVKPRDAGVVVQCERQVPWRGASRSQLVCASRSMY